MSGSFSAAGQPDRTGITEYDDPEVPWNQVWDRQGGIVDWIMM